MKKNIFNYTSIILLILYIGLVSSSTLSAQNNNETIEKNNVFRLIEKHYENSNGIWYTYTYIYNDKGNIIKEKEESYTNVDKILEGIKQIYSNEKLNLTDGVKIEFENEWVHLRKSNTEPIIRIYSESRSKEKADGLAKRLMEEIRKIT